MRVLLITKSSMIMFSKDVKSSILARIQKSDKAKSCLWWRTVSATIDILADANISYKVVGDTIEDTVVLADDGAFI